MSAAPPPPVKSIKRLAFLLPCTWMHSGVVNLWCWGVHYFSAASSSLGRVARLSVDFLIKKGVTFITFLRKEHLGFYYHGGYIKPGFTRSHLSEIRTP